MASKAAVKATAVYGQSNVQCKRLQIKPTSNLNVSLNWRRGFISLVYKWLLSLSIILYGYRQLALRTSFDQVVLKSLTYTRMLTHLRVFAGSLCTLPMIEFAAALHFVDCQLTLLNWIIVRLASSLRHRDKQYDGSIRCSLLLTNGH